MLEGERQIHTSLSRGRPYRKGDVRLKMIKRRLIDMGRFSSIQSSRDYIVEHDVIFKKNLEIINLGFLTNETPMLGQLGNSIAVQCP